MINIKEYLKAPIFESTKSRYIVRYQNEAERRLMMEFDENPKIKNYFQPLVYTAVKIGGGEYFITINFCVEYATGKIDLIHLEAENEFPEALRRELFAEATNRLKANNLGFIAIKESKQKQELKEHLISTKGVLTANICPANFDWVN